MKRSLLFIFLIITSVSFSQNNIVSSWKGKLFIIGTEAEIIFRISIEKDSISGKLDIPVQNVKNLPVNNLLISDSSLYFEILGGQALGKFDGKISGSEVKGEFSQSGFKGTFQLSRYDDSETPKDQSLEEQVPPPYSSDEVEFFNGDIKLTGTLTYPFEGSNFPAVVLITGSGPQNRDEEIYGFKIFGLIADYLTKNQIVVLRYDDRGVGGSSGSTQESTTEDFAYDVKSAVDFLLSKDFIDKNRIGLIGHSEGGIVAPLTATISDDVNFLVLIAGTGVTGEKIIREQTKLILESDDYSEDFILLQMEELDLILRTLKENKPLSDIRNELLESGKKQIKYLPDEMKKSISDTTQFAETYATSKEFAFGSQWMEFFLKYDPAITLQYVDAPVLMLFGELDLQVPTSINISAMENALREGGNTNFETVVFPKANHLFQEAVKGSPEEYSKLEKKFVPGFLEKITEWIKETK